MTLLKFCVDVLPRTCTEGSHRLLASLCAFGTYVCMFVLYAHKYVHCTLYSNKSHLPDRSTLGRDGRLPQNLSLICK